MKGYSSMMHVARNMCGRSWFVVPLLCVTMGVAAGADRSPASTGYDTIDGMFAAYRTATQDRDWKALFLLGTPARQDGELLMLAVNAVTSKDTTLRRLFEKYGANLKQFDHEWTDADNQRFVREFPARAASFGTTITNKAELYVEARRHLDKNSELLSTQVVELTNVARDGATAVGESRETNTCIERHFDAGGNQTRQVSRTVAVRSRLCFRQIDGRWYLASESEIGSAK